jgi:dTDP-glucose 4,6-dehydratase
VGYVSDTIDGVELLMMSDYARPMIIGNPGEVSMNQLAGESIALTKSFPTTTQKSESRT